LNALLFLLAQTTQSITDQTGAGGTEQPPLWARPEIVLYAILCLGILFVFSSSGRANRQKEKRHREMLASLKRGDRVQTIGGILGAVVEVRDDEVVIKVDESNNTKIRLTRDAIKTVTREEAEVQAK
jgi:preprotein translocase subunit YajC